MKKIDWTSKMDSLIGTESDYDVAKKLGISQFAVRKRRSLLGVPKCPAIPRSQEFRQKNRDRTRSLWSGEVVNGNKWDESKRQKIRSRLIPANQQNEELTKKRTQASGLSQLGVEKTHPKQAKGNDNAAAKQGSVRSPNNVVYEFENMAHFIRENQSLFLEDDIKGDRVEHTLAYRGLGSLRPKRKRVRSSWKGWTWHSFTESFYNQDKDLIARDE